MTPLIQKFRADIEAALIAYEKQFNLKNMMSERRKKDIHHIRRLLKQEFYDVKHYLSSIKYYLNNNLKTGFWFFQTGNSQLKSLLLKAMDNFKQENINVLLKPDKQYSLTTYFKY